MPARPLSVLIAEDHSLIRNALELLLSGYPDLEVVGTAANVEETVSVGTLVRPQVALVDLQMPGAAGHAGNAEDEVPNGVRVVAALARLSPETRCLILSAYREPEALRAALNAGARGYLVKDTSPAKLVIAIKQVAAGDLVIDDKLAARIALAKPCPLTRQEVAVLRHARDFLTVAEIARTMRLSGGTVRNYLTRAIQKTGARNRHEAVRIAAANDWL
ncbi:DNA-binding response regulator [Sphaerisporangium krabiense]|uniref:Two-component system response regulator DesR n=1 Tax=Sphaerisporangium krabiense TaxID=763782 RepID=A0A7W8Z7E8_9ACTN|nr:response regulator transcription factor [Sphaerisporangium krabiense]MBB5628729.1 two-component system response regulator DesR [Sphaerisporangium krabiense]GII60432.1 DNA-binding response regulator [Sphaerisporangium krabiense]